MEAVAPAAAADDLSAIAWVHEELRRSLDAAHKHLRRFVKDAEATTGSDVGAVDPGVLRTARAQIHQGVGALELVGLPAAAVVLRASETAVQRAIAKPAALTNELVSDIERSSFALLDYLARLLAGKSIAPLALFPQYRAVQEAVEADRVHPADLWAGDWRWRTVEPAAGAAPRRADAETRNAIESHLLAILRSKKPETAAASLSDVWAGLAAGSSHPNVRTFWSLAAAMFEAQADNRLPFDVFTKRVASRLLAQFRILQRGDSDVSERLARDVLFFCAQAARPDSAASPRLDAVREGYALAETPTDYALSALGRFDPALIALARKRVVAAKETWSATAGGELHRVSALSEQFALVGDSLRRLFPLGEAFATELQTAVQQTQASGKPPPAPIAMEVATSILAVEAALEDGDFDHPELADRVRRLAERLGAVREGAAPAPLEPWMEELYRRVSDRQTMGSVVQELRASLGEVENAIDAFFRRPEDTGALSQVPQQLGSMRGVLSVLGMDHAAQVLMRMRDEVDGLLSTKVDPQRVRASGTFDRIAGNLSALGFLIDMLAVQPQMAKSLFVYDAEAGTLAPVMGRSGAAATEALPTGPVDARLIEQAQLLAFSSVRPDVPLESVALDLERLAQEAQAADQPALAAAVQRAQEALGRAQDSESVTTLRGELSEVLVDFVSNAAEPEPAFEPIVEPASTAPASAAAIAAVSDIEHDDEMREIFLEEAREVVETARTATAQLRQSPSDLGLLTTVRRAFHTLKGSSRMVGLASFGEAAWACEQVYNTQLAEQRAAEPQLVNFTEGSLARLAAWVEAIASRAEGGFGEGEIKLAADRLARRLQEGGDAADIALDVGSVAPAPLPAASPLFSPEPPAPFTRSGFGGLPDDLPSRQDLDLTFKPLPGDGTAGKLFDDMAFELDLSGFERLPAAQPAGADERTGPDVSAMFDHFDESAPEPEPVDEGPSYADSGLVDLDLGDQAPASSFADLELDLGAAAGGVDLPIEPENVKIVGPLRIGIPLFNIFLNEADELSRRLVTEVGEWSMQRGQPIADSSIALAHSLAGSSATVGFAALSSLARSLEHAMTRSRVIGEGTIDEALLFAETSDEIRRLLNQFAAGFLRDPPPGLLQRLAEHDLRSAERLERATAASELATAPEPDALPSDDRRGDPAVDEALPEFELDLGATDDRPAAERSAAAVEVASTSDAVEPIAVEPIAVEPVAVEPIAAEPIAEKPLPIDAAPDARPVDVFEALAPSIDAVELPADDVAPAAEAAEPVAPSPVEPAAAVPALGIAELKTLAEAPMAEAPRTAGPRGDTALDDEDAIDSVDAIDLELFPLFEEEAQELLPKLASQLRAWSVAPTVSSHAAASMRTLHTLKGAARLAGAMRIGEMAHRLETRIERLVGADAPAADTAAVDVLQARADGMAHAFDALVRRDAQAYADAVADAVAPAATALAPTAEAAAPAPAPLPLDDAAPSPTPAVEPTAIAADDGASDGGPELATGPAALDAKPEKRSRKSRGRTAPEPASESAPPPAPMVASAQPAPPTAPPASTPATAPSEPVPLAATAPIDWSRFARRASTAPKPSDRNLAASQSAVRVRAPLLDRLVNQAGEVSITRSRIETGVGQIKSSLADLTENLERLRGQLRDLELQGEVQMTSRLEAAKAASQAFDPLEFDRFTRFQELTRMMAESVNDVATVQRTLQRSLDSAEDELVAQARLTRDLQDDLLRTRMVEFEGLSDRLYRVVRQAAKESGKQVRLDIVGGSIEVDRGVLDRMTGAFEHLLRNCVVHGIEKPEIRTAGGKDATGSITVALSQEGNEVGVDVRDDGGGLDLSRIRAKGIAAGLLDAAKAHDDAELANLIFQPGFTTVTEVTELAGRGVGMDVVRSEVIAMGGRIETATAPGQGTSFKLVLPLTTAVTQVVMLRCGDSTVAVPSTLVEVVQRAKPSEIAEGYATGTYGFGDRVVPFFWLGALLQLGSRPTDPQGRTSTVVIVRSAQQRIAAHVDEVLGNQEVVVKNLGPQLSRLPGLAGMTLMPSGAVALIYNPVALATLYGDGARLAAVAPVTVAGTLDGLPAAVPATPAQQAPLVLVVDDSLTVRRVTQRLLQREGYRVVLAKDGLDALEKLSEELPKIVLSDIEMPRMDGFDLVRNLRADARWRALPVVMITSRIAQKHKDHATELGVDHYLGKPYSEDELLALVARYTRQTAEA